MGARASCMLRMQGFLGQYEKLMREDPSLVPVRQFEQAANPGIHYATTGPEIWSQTQGKIDFFVAGSGTGGTITGMSCSWVSRWSTAGNSMMHGSNDHVHHLLRVLPYLLRLALVAPLSHRCLSPEPCQHLQGGKLMQHEAPALNTLRACESDGHPAAPFIWQACRHEPGGSPSLK